MAEEPTRTVVTDRHWMHIWKVGFRRCAKCSHDARRVVTLLDANDKVINQTLFCYFHSPKLTDSPDTPSGPEDAVQQLKMSLGTSFTVAFDDDATDD